MNRYAQVLDPWAKSVAGRMLAEVSRRDEDAWAQMSKDMSRALRTEIQTAPIGEAMRQLLADQVALIKSLPTDAAQRVHRLVQEGMFDGVRASETAKEIMRSGEVTKSRATLIARTETSRAATVLTQVRAEHVGITHFVWSTSEDGDVRPSHKKLAGKVFRWDDPPECDPGHRALPGAIWNCRCFPSPVIGE
jgi:SPP1 gp7 family putative phage head morphogenesis protein